MFKVIWQINGKAGVQTLDYQVLKSSLFKIRSMEKEFSMITNTLTSSLIHADKGDEVNDLVKGMMLRRTWVSSL